MASPETRAEPGSRSNRPLLLGLAAAAVCLGFAAYTSHIWEDYFITFRASLNLATGHGLVFQPGERVHTFTSPLGTLLPALFALGGGDDVALRALWLFRFVSAAALGAALWLALRAMQREAIAPVAMGAAALAWALDPKTIDFAINGMETALLVFFIVVTWEALAHGARPWSGALGFAGLQWTRPDGCVFFATLGLAWLCFGSPHAPATARRLAPLARAVAWGALLYLPWIALTWVYYGTPVPHTIQAKVSHHGPGELVQALALYPWRLLFDHVALHGVFMPAYFFLGGWPPVVAVIARLLAVGSAVTWAIPGIKPAGRIASAAFFLGGFYVEYIPRSPWYYPGWQALGFLAWAYLLHAALTHARRPRWSLALARVAAALLVLAQGALLVAVAWQMRVHQRVIEDGQRTSIGRWLRAAAATGDRVYLEPLGYIGYYSGLKMLDYPGLASPEVVAARRAGNRTHAQVIAALQPEWLVLRPDQVQGVQAAAPHLLAQDYRLVRTYDVRPALDAVRLLPGRGYLEFDAVYLVFQHAAPLPRRP